MPKRIILTEEQEDWLIENCDRLSYADQARHIGCCVDTLKRLLMRRDLVFFEGAKFATSTSSQLETWNRPCNNCGCTKTRPKWQFVCDHCRSKWDSTENDDGW